MGDELVAQAAEEALHNQIHQQLDRMFPHNDHDCLRFWFSDACSAGNRWRIGLLIMIIAGCVWLSFSNYSDSQDNDSKWEMSSDDPSSANPVSRRDDQFSKDSLDESPESDQRNPVQSQSRRRRLEEDILHQNVIHAIIVLVVVWVCYALYL